MSSAKKDRNLQSLSGRTFPPHTKARLGANGYAQAIAGALHAEYGGTHAAVKTVVDQTGANARAVRNWFDAKNGPSGEFLIALCHHSDHILETVLAQAGRGELIKAKKLEDAKVTLRKALSLLEDIEEQSIAK
jgi:hypothetical protein